MFNIAQCIFITIVYHWLAKLIGPILLSPLAPNQPSVDVGGSFQCFPKKSCKPRSMGMKHWKSQFRTILGHARSVFHGLCFILVGKWAVLRHTHASTRKRTSNKEEDMVNVTKGIVLKKYCYMGSKCNAILFQIVYLSN